MLHKRAEEGAKNGQGLIAKVNKTQKLLISVEDEPMPEAVVDEEAG